MSTAANGAMELGSELLSASWFVTELGFTAWVCCLVPVTLALGIVVVTWVWGGVPKVDLQHGHEPAEHGEPSKPAPALEAALFLEIQEEWAAQQKRSEAAFRPGVLLALLHGLLATLGLLVSVHLLRNLLPSCQAPGCGSGSTHGLLQQVQWCLANESFYRWTMVQLSALAVAANISVHTALTYGKLYRRAARRDLTPRAFADELRGFFAGLLVALSVIALLQIENRWLEPRLALLVGGMMSIIGPPLLELIEQGSAVIFGLYSTSEDGLVDCTAVDGLDDVDRQRLQEIGIDSLHSLAYASVALIYFSSRYSYERICDWKDQALLQVLVGQELKAALTRRYGIRGATDLCSMEQSERAQIGQELTKHPASCVIFTRAASERSVRLMRAWKASRPTPISPAAPALRNFFGRLAFWRSR